MDIITVVKTFALAASLVLLTACSSSDNIFEQTSTSDTNETEPANNGSASDNTALSDERAQFSVLDCGSLPVSTVLPGNAVSAPSTMIVGQLVSGRLNPESSTNTEHFWSIELERGNYHLVIDTEGVDGGWSDLGIRVADIRDSGEVELLADDKTDYRARFHTYFSVEVARTMVLRIQGNSSAEDYVFALFNNGSRVPAPFFSECPIVNLLSLDTTESLVLPRVEKSTDYQWFKAPLATASYSINTSASPLDGASCQIQYEFILVEQFGQNERITPIGSIERTGSVVTDAVVEFNRSGFDPAWIRIQNNNCELSVEFTLSEVES